jgi:WD40 repeat protein
VEASGHPDTIVAVALSPDGGKAVTTTSTGQVQVWDTAAGERLQVTIGDGFFEWTGAAAFSADGSRVLLAEQFHQTGVWDLGTGKKVLSIKAHEIGASINDIPAVALSPDGKRVAAGFASDGYTGVWSVDPPDKEADPR